ncbi:MAG: alpha-amylase [Lachnospiraceae bacterium]|jgi:glycosidase|nr:alpha-amylase [Lachnospiraceae bacterium]
MDHFWYETATIYHIFTFSLAGAPPQNDYGEQPRRLDAIARWIPHIRELGCDTVLLSPVLLSRSHGYDVTDYRRVDNRLGSNGDFRTLVDAFHGAGIRVVLDSVFNHCGRDFFAFEALRKGERSYADWFSGVRFDRQSPMGDAFDYDTWSGYYELVKFNLKNPAVREYLFGSVEFWLDGLGIDGMRLDSANVLDFGFMGDLRAFVLARRPDFWLMGEVVSGDYARWVNPQVLHSVTNYILYKSLFSSHNDNNLYELAHCLKQSVPDQGRPLYTFLDNHDQPRIASNAKDPRFLRTLYALLFTLPGIPSIYYGSEWGIQGRKEHGSDAPLRPYLDPGRAPEDTQGLIPLISTLSHLRRAHPALTYGDYREVSLGYHRPLVFSRTHGDETVFVAVHVDDSPATIDLAGHTQGMALTDLLTGETIGPAQTGAIPIGPCDVRILA